MKSVIPMKDFKMPLFVIGIIGLLLISGCVNPTNSQLPDDQLPDQQPDVPASGWVYYAPVQAHTNPWQVNAEVDSDEWELKEWDLLKTWLHANGITTTQFGFIPHDEIVCAALNCPRGDYALVKPTTQAGYDKLIQLGFKPYMEVGVLALATNDTIQITVVNASNDTIFYGGCNEFTLEKITANETIPIIPKTCVWEGIPSQLEAGDDISFTYEAMQSGKYRIVFGYGTDCEEGVQASLANCNTHDIIYSEWVDVTAPGASDYVNMVYDIKQCNTNPWQGGIDSNSMSPAEDQDAFTEWIEDNGLHPLTVTYIPAEPGTMVCLSCACASGHTYQIVIPASEQANAEGLEFTYNGAYFPTLSPPTYSDAMWFVFTPYQCFANQWNTNKEPVHSVEKDMQLMKIWLEKEGVTVDYLAFIRGVSLSAQCTKLSTDKYAVGILDSSDAELLHELGFVDAGKTQVELFTNTTEVKPVTLLYKTKFCASNPWGEPLLDMENPAEVAVAVTQWLADQGIETNKPVSIHTTPISFSGTCDTDSGLGVLVSVPTWAETHLGTNGFAKPSTYFTLNQDKTEIYPSVQEEETGELTYTYDLKQCESPPWLESTSTGENPSQHESKLANWLKLKGVIVSDVEYIPADEDGLTCSACGCPTGVSMKIVIPASGADTVEAFGFVAETA